jgi:hypothetical protein
MKQIFFFVTLKRKHSIFFISLFKSDFFQTKKKKK